MTTLTIELLKKWRSQKILEESLESVTSLTTEAAELLAKGRMGQLDLLMLKETTTSVLRALCRSKSSLVLGLTDLSIEQAEVLSSYGGKDRSLYLPELTQISEEIAAMLGQLKIKRLGLGLTSLSREVAAQLAKFSGNSLELENLSTLHHEAAEELGKRKGHTMTLAGEASLTEEAAKAIGRWRGEYLTIELAIFGEASGRALAQHRRMDLSLPKLQDLEAAKSIAAHYPGHTLTLGVTSLKEGLAAALAGFSGPQLNLLEVTELSDEEAEQISSWKGSGLWLCGLTRISREGAARLARWGGPELYLGPISDEAHDEITKSFRGGSLRIIRPEDLEESTDA